MKAFSGNSKCKVASLFYIKVLPQYLNKVSIPWIKMNHKQDLLLWLYLNVQLCNIFTIWDIFIQENANVHLCKAFS